MKALATRKNTKAAPSTILERVADHDKTAVKECIDTYGSLIWSLARKLTLSREDAEAATEEIFTDIWRYCQKPVKPSGWIEHKLIATIAVRRLIDRSRSPEQRVVKGDTPTERTGGRNEKYVKLA